MAKHHIIKVDKDPEPEIIKKAAGIIRDKGVVVIPTWCLYGLAADALDSSAIDKIFKIKTRPENKPLLILVSEKKQIEKLVKSVPETAVKIMDHFWPGRITIVFDAEDHLPHNLTAGSGKIGIRIPENPVAFALAKQFNGPITGTSANISDRPGCSDIRELDGSIIKNSDLVLDYGPLKGGEGSTVIDVTSSSPKILRQGEIPAEKIFDIL